MRRIVVGLGLCLAALAAPVAQAQEAAVQMHEVRPGDTLWGLAAHYLGDPFLWSEIFSANRQTVRDPHQIFPRDRLRIPGARSFSPFGAMPAALPGATATAETPERTVFFRGAAEEAEGQAAVGVGPALPRADTPVVPPGAYFGAGILVPDAEFAPVGELVEVVGPTMIRRRTPPQIQPYDRVLVRLLAPVAPGDRVHLMKPGRVVQPYGRIFTSSGSAVVLAVEEGVATVEVDVLYDRVDLGHLALPMPGFPVPSGARPSPASGVEGRLLALDEPQPIVGTEDRVYLDLGSASGVVEGDEFVAYLPATEASWGTRPEVEVARLQVVRAGRLTSAARVVALEHPALEPGLPIRLVAKMP